MGLDITAYSNLKSVGKHAKDWCEDYKHHVQAYAYTDFPQSFRGLPVLTTEGNFMFGGCYAFTPATLRHGFQAGSYSGYGAWRDDLRGQFNPNAEPDAPFFELIFFADNEGSIGPEAAADLLADFRAHADVYALAGGRPDWWRQKYADWTRACELAADGGLVDFH